MKSSIHTVRSGIPYVTQQPKTRVRRSILPYWALLLLVDWILPTGSHGQIIPDDTLPQNSTLERNGGIARILGGTEAGPNLLHSFQEFNVRTGETAYFDNALTIDNIITRVTGGQTSQIDGFLQANGTANLFLVNPNGIIFGTNAQLNLGGSFFASTADGVLFEDGSLFSATEANATPLLTVSVPVGLQYGSNPGAIVNRSRADSILPLPNPDGVGLEVSPGQTLALVGGNVSVEGGGLRAVSGTIELGSVAESGSISIAPATPVRGQTLDYDGVTNFGDLQISAASVDVSGLGGGAIRVRGDRVLVTEGSSLRADTFGEFAGRGIEIQAGDFQLRDRAFVSSSTFGTGDAGALQVRADRIELAGTVPLGVSFQLVAGTFDPLNLSDGLYGISAGSGAAADITLEGDRILVRDGATVMTTTIFDGAGGDILLNATESADLINGSLFVAGTTGSGDSGQITAIAPQLLVADGTSLSTTPSFLSTGRGGDLTAIARSIELRGTPAGAPVPAGLFTTTLGAGDAGNLEVQTDRLIVADGAQISAAAAGSGRGGNLTIVATESVDLSGIAADGRFLGGFFTSSSLLTLAGQRGTSGAGDLTITTDRLRVRDGAQISVATGGDGAAGSLRIEAESVEVSGFATGVDPLVESVSFGIIGDGIVPSAIESNTSGAGNAGNVEIRTDRLRVGNGAEIGVRGTGSGVAGNLDIAADRIIVDGGSALTAATVSGGGGNIQLRGSDLRLLGNSRIATDAGNVDGGNITIEMETLVGFGNSDITANAQQGRGGRVEVSADGIFGIQFRPVRTPQSDITATSELGAEFSGVVTVQTPDVDPGAALVPLPTNPIDRADRVQAGCAAYAGSQFTIVGRGGLPHDPTTTIPAQTVWQDWRDYSDVSQTGVAIPVAAALLESGVRLVEATGWLVNEEGRVELVAQLPASGMRPELSGCITHQAD